MQIMKGSEFLKKLKTLAERKGWSYKWHPDEGKGSHGALYLNGQKTIVRNLKDELKTGTYHAMLKQLGIKESDLHK
ncbi:MAG: type II toxin-antitoxin system HicA family toxin [Sideroxydans sp.]|nr:type II toxin-antitoxin system HicA family toxin [Sideroxydans sp.]